MKKLHVPKADEAQLDPLFRRIPNGLAIHRMTRERGKYAAAFKRFLVSFVEELRRTGDDPEGAVYLNMLLATSPPELILEAIAPELEAGGKLEGALDGENNDIAKSIQNQHQQSHPDFSVYARYLSGKDIAESPALIRHLMQTDPHQALQVLLSVRYNVPFPPTGKRQSRYGDGKALLFAQHLARDVMFHEEFGFELGPERLEKAKQVLREIAERDEWWVRRYVATVMSRSEALKDAEVLERVQEGAER